MAGGDGHALSRFDVPKPHCFVLATTGQISTTRTYVDT